MTFVLLFAALATIALMFVHPSVAIFMFWFGMMVAGVSAIVEWRLCRRERREVRKALMDHHCPNCGFGIEHDPGQSPRWHCDQCGSEFSTDGDVWSLNA